MEYEVTREYVNREFEFVLLAGDWVYDGDFDPDLIAQLVSDGVLVAPDQLPEIFPVDDEPTEDAE